MSKAESPRPEPLSHGAITEIEHRVTYAETDQMGVVYHANYLVWFEMARTEHLRRTGVTYRELEEQGVFLAVVEAHVKDVGSRRVTFGYLAERAEDREPLAMGETSLIALNRQYVPSRLPEHVLDLLEPAPDPVRP